jgi:hypothetical protein
MGTPFGQSGGLRVNAILVRAGDLVGAVWGLIKRNPVYSQALVQATIGIATSFGLGWTAQQVGSVMAGSAAVLAFLTQTQVTPTAAPSLPVGTSLTVTTPPGEADRQVTLR